MALTQVPNAMLSSDLQGVTPGFKNRLINGGMTIAQRGTASVAATTSNLLAVDRWFGYNSTASSKYTMQQNAATVTPPVGFTDYLGATSSSAYSVAADDYFGLTQRIEGFNVADLGWGTANAKTVTLSFWVRSSLTGTFGGGFSNAAYNRGYPFTYTISSANTWEYKTVTVAGDTTGTWGTTNGMGIELVFSLGTGSNIKATPNVWTTGWRFPTGETSVVGTSGATFYITGVQFEKGSTATAFDYRSYGQELALCQRYFETGYFDGVGAYIAGAGASIYNLATFSVTKRSTSLTLVGSTGTSYSSATGTWSTQASGGGTTTRAVNISGGSNNGFNSLFSTSDPRVTGYWWISTEL
jgi:hypothetical protein